MELKLDLTRVPRGQRNPREVKEMDHSSPIRVKPRQIRHDGNSARFIPCRDCQPDHVDELVKHMSNLPGYLQRVENGENVLVKAQAFNVGVFDWGRLEKWKYGQQCGTSGDSCNVFSGANNVSSKTSIQPPKVPHSDARSYENQQGNSVRVSHFHSRLPTQNDIRFQDTESASRNCRSSGRSSEVKNFDKGKQRDFHVKVPALEMEGSSNWRHDAGAYYAEPKHTVKKKKQMGGDRKDLDASIFSKQRSSSLKMRNFAVQPRSEEKSNVVGESKTKELRNSAVDLSHQHKFREEDDIVLVLPRRLSHTNNANESLPLYDNKFTETDRSSLSRNISPGEIPSRTKNDSGLPTTTNMATNTRASRPSLDSMQSLYTERRFSNAADGNVFEYPFSLDQETAEPESKKGRHPSPNRRFSFSLGRMARSFSFKETSAVPQLSSTYVSAKSGPVLSNPPACMDSSNGGKASFHNRDRPSPFRRILEPLLRSKSMGYSRFSNTDNFPKERLSSSSAKPSSVSESVKDSKRESTSLKAILRLAMGNGIPLFRFMVDNSNRTLVATKQNSTTASEKDETGCNFTFYSVDEIKKKSNSWIHHGRKEKSYGHVYSVIGQMKVTSSSLFDLAEDSKMIQRESVLYGVEPSQEDQALAKSMPKRELAAVTVKTDSSYSFGGNADSNFVMVLLPGAAHGLPNKGAPSSLIHRWKSSGSCDCGGWDVGCKLKILSNENRGHKFPWTSIDSLESDCCQLFVEGEDREDKPVFSLALIEKGAYSIEFSPSISFLQAFFISVTVVSCQELHDHAGSHNALEEKPVQGPWKLNDGRTKFGCVFMEDAPIKYASNPPHSPVGRV